MPVRYEFEKELNRLHKDIIKMGAFIEESIDDMIKALIKKDVQLANHVIKKDDLIDEMERKIERECLIIVARQQPIATDLRDVASIMKIVTDLERIADQCEDISKLVIRIAELEQVKEVEDIPKMAEAMSVMIQDTIDAYVRKDLELAKEIVERDDIIDKYYADMIVELTEIMENDSTQVKACINYLLISKYMERMADHAVNIAEWIIYYVTGEIQ